MKSARYARVAAGTESSPARVAPRGDAPAGAVAAPATAAGAARGTATRPPAGGTADDAAAAAPDAGLCGHRNMSGKACRRPLGHTEKSHRYT